MLNQWPMLDLTSSSIHESIRVKIEACLHSNTNLKSSRSSRMEALNSLEPPTEKIPKRFYEKTRVFQDTWAKPTVGDDGLIFQV